jgi:dynamin family protein
MPFASSTSRRTEDEPMTSFDELFDELRTDLLALCARIEEQAGALDAPLAAQDLAEATRRLAEGKLRVACVGEFNRGKSTLLNVLLEQTRPLLPVAPIPKTRLITRLEYGAEEAYYLLDDSGQRTPIIRNDIERYAAEPDDAVAANRVEARQVVIQLPHEKLRSGLVLLDTPGVGGIYAAHDKITDDALADADAILFVAGLSEPLTDRELRFLERAGTAVRARETRDAMLIAFNMIDLRSPYDAELAKCRADALDRTKLQPSELPVLPVSALSKLNYLKHGDVAFLEESGIPELEAELWARLLCRRVRVLLGEAVDRAEQAVTRLIQPLQDEEITRRDESGQELRRIAGDIADGQARLATLESEGAAWRTEIDNKLSELGSQMVDRCLQGCAVIWQRAKTDLLSDQYYLIDPSRLGAQLNSLFRVQLKGVEDWAARQAARLQRDCAARWQLELPDTALDGITDVSILDLPEFDVLQERIRIVTRTTPETREYIGEAMMSRSGAKASVFQRGLIAVGSVFGRGGRRWAANLAHVELVPQYWTIGGETYTEQVNEGYSQQDLYDRRRELEETLRDARSRAGVFIEQSVNDQITALSAAVVLEMEWQIKLERERLNRTLPRLLAQQTETRQQAEARLAELAKAMRPVKALRQRVQGLRKEVLQLTKKAR